jgi:ketosteroid isomerase-like protein
MSEGSAETARRVIEGAYGALSRSDLDEWLDSTTPDFAIGDLPEMPDADVHRGREAAKRWAEANLTSVEEWNWAPEEFLFNDGSTVVVRTLLTGRSVAGVPIDMTIFHGFEMSEGKLKAVSGFLNKAQALEAARLPAET